MALPNESLRAFLRRRGHGWAGNSLPNYFPQRPIGYYAQPWAPEEIWTVPAGRRRAAWEFATRHWTADIPVRRGPRKTFLPWLPWVSVASGVGPDNWASGSPDD